MLLYHHAAAACSILDMKGNVLSWVPQARNLKGSGAACTVAYWFPCLQPSAPKVYPVIKVLFSPSDVTGSFTLSQIVFIPVMHAPSCVLALIAVYKVHPLPALFLESKDCPFASPFQFFLYNWGEFCAKMVYSNCGSGSVQEGI